MDGEASYTAETYSKTTLEKAISNGQTTRVWQDSWISLTTQVKPLGPIPEAELDLTVSDLLTDDMKWNNKRVKEVLPHLAEQVLQLQPSQTGAEDIIIWQPTASGVYSTKSGYTVASSSRNTTAPPDDFEWIRDVWSSQCSPKMKVFLWSIIQKALPLGTNLQSRGIKAQAKCVRCDEIETAMHIFFECPFAKEVWKKIPLQRTVNTSSMAEFKEAVVAFRKSICIPPSGVTNLILPWICWSLWIARNTLIFENRYISQEEVATKGIRLAKEWGLAQPPRGQGSKGLPIRNLKRNQELEEDRTLICRTDAAWEKTTNKAGLRGSYRRDKPSSESNHYRKICIL